MNKGIQISGGTFVGGAFAAGDGAIANTTNGRLAADLEAILLPLLKKLSDQGVPSGISYPIEQASATLRKECSSPTPDKSKVREALEAIGKAEPVIKGVGAIVGSIATLFGIL